jgi:uncharacterized protein YjeT (DUF2065 family)
MAVIVLIVGLIVLGMGILVLISPASLKRMLHIFVAKQWWYFVTGIRILVGILFILVASETRSPLFVRTVGVLFILAGLVVPLMGAARIQRLVSWWLERSDATLRLWALFSIVFGAAILWSGFNGYLTLDPKLKLELRAKFHNTVCG